MGKIKVIHRSLNAMTAFIVLLKERNKINQRSPEIQEC
jgi:hypothetical protein